MVTDDMKWEEKEGKWKTSCVDDVRDHSHLLLLLFLHALSLQ